KRLAGGPPFLAETLAETWEQVRSQMPPPPSSIQPGVPAALDAICRKCLAKAPAGRYASAGELAEQLAGFLATDRPGASPTGTWARIGGGRPRWPWEKRRGPRDPGQLYYTPTRWWWRFCVIGGGGS